MADPDWQALQLKDRAENLVGRIQRCAEYWRRVGLPEHLARRSLNQTKRGDPVSDREWRRKKAGFRAVPVRQGQNPVIWPNPLSRAIVFDVDQFMVALLIDIWPEGDENREAG